MPERTEKDQEERVLEAQGKKEAISSSQQVSGERVEIFPPLPEPPHAEIRLQRPQSYQRRRYAPVHSEEARGSDEEPRASVPETTEISSWTEFVDSLTAHLFSTFLLHKLKEKPEKAEKPRMTAFARAKHPKNAALSSIHFLGGLLLFSILFGVALRLLYYTENAQSVDVLHNIDSLFHHRYNICRENAVAQFKDPVLYLRDDEIEMHLFKPSVKSEKSETKLLDILTQTWTLWPFPAPPSDWAVRSAIKNTMKKTSLASPHSVMIKNYTPRSYHVLKSIDHVVLNTVLLVASQDQPGNGAAMLEPRIATKEVLDEMKQLVDLSERLERYAKKDLNYGRGLLRRLVSGGAIPEDEIAEKELVDRQKRILGATRDLLHSVMKSGILPSRSQLIGYVQGLKKDVLDNVCDAAGAQILLLHKRVEELKGEVGNDNVWSQSEVIISGPHQPRVGNLRSQYFARRFPGLTVGRNAHVKVSSIESNPHLVYAESVDDKDALQRMLGTHLLDIEISRIFFGDAEEETRMQRDLLSEGAQEMLDSIFPADVDEPLPSDVSKLLDEVDEFSALRVARSIFRLRPTAADRVVLENQPSFSSDTSIQQNAEQPGETTSTATPASEEPSETFGVSMFEEAWESETTHKA